MIARSSWRGYLRLSLVSCPVELVNAVDSTERISFRTLNRETGNPVRRRYVDSVTGEPVAEENEVKGYEVAENAWLLLEKEEIESVQLPSSHTIELQGFLDRDDVPRVYLDHPYYVTPSNEGAIAAFEVIRAAMLESGKAGLTRIVMYGREHPAMVEPYADGLLLTTLRYERSIRPPDSLRDSRHRKPPPPELVSLASELMLRKQAVFEPEGFEDAYEAALRGLIEAKQQGLRPPLIEPPPPEPAIANLGDALRRSLAAERPRRPAGIRSARGLPSPEPGAPRKRA